MASLKGLWSEFKAFAFKGNMIDLAVAVVIGAAFSGVITALVSDIIMPGISYVVTAAKETTEVATTAAQKAGSVVGATTAPSTEATTEPSAQPAAAAAPPAPPPAPAAAPAATDAKAVDFTWKIGRFKIGDFVGQIINFLLVAFAVFIFIVKLLGSVMKRAGGTPAPSEPTTRECPLCLSVIPIKAKRCAHCTADLTVPA
jgi:large conductance mechanosensitive channel